MMRRLVTRWVPVAALALACSLAAVSPAAAQTAPGVACPAIYPVPAYCNQPVAENPVAPLNHVGWVYLNLNSCPVGAACLAVYRDSTIAWRWSDGAWSQSSLRQGWVYVYPYTGSWRWAWTQDTGWVAVNTGRFEIRRY